MPGADHPSAESVIPLPSVLGVYWQTGATVAVARCWRVDLELQTTKTLIEPRLE